MLSNKSFFVKRKILETTDSSVAGMYGLLASLFAREIDQEQLTQLRSPAFREVLEALEVDLGDEFFTQDQESLLEELAIEFTALFIGPGNFISPHESVHHQRDDGDHGKLWGADTVAVKKFIEATGLEYQAGFGGMPDHIAAELEFVQKLEERIGSARADGQSELVDNLELIKGRFLTEHLLAWGPGLMDKVIKKARLSFYREIAVLTKGFLLQEEELMKQQMDLQNEGAAEV